ncbi:hypothetical protein SSA02_01690 [Swaminathania salitolerans]|uniref:Uncharacterized protein n=1 Tax=Swaminathania salitolerans TaxID=182838 RepID=A0A511BKX6_9PROT|nr:hypothetical protein SSA02_01690 [Swaminathania salitolerans]
MPGEDSRHEIYSDFFSNDDIFAEHRQDNQNNLFCLVQMSLLSPEFRARFAVVPVA